MAKIKVKRGRAKPLWFGHPWLYSQAIERIEGAAEPGDVVDVIDEEGRFIGRGFYNPGSQIAVRMLTREPVAIDEAFFLARLEAAIALRARLSLPSAETTAYRLVNAEGDGLAGLVVDVYADVACVQIGSLGMKRHEAFLARALAERLGLRAVYAVAAGGVSSREGFTTAPGILHGEETPLVRFREHGLELSMEPEHGQKTGAYLDQRENHARIGRLARPGGRALDLYTNLGGFALHALARGAGSAVAVDMSPRALARAKEHARWAGTDARLELVEADVFRYLEGCEGSFDLIIVDPPKFAANRGALEAALKGYRKLNAMALRRAAPGAIVATASCSQAVDVEAFERAIAAAAVDAGRRIRVLETLHQPADHPVPPGFSEGRYLKMLVLCVD